MVKKWQEQGQETPLWEMLASLENPSEAESDSVKEELDSVKGENKDIVWDLLTFTEEKIPEIQEYLKNNFKLFFGLEAIDSETKEKCDLWILESGFNILYVNHSLYEEWECFKVFVEFLNWKKKIYILEWKNLLRLLSRVETYKKLKKWKIKQ